MRMESPYPERRRKAVIIAITAVVSSLAIKSSFEDNFKCEGSQIITVRNKTNPDGTINPDNHFTVWDAIDDNVSYNQDTVDKQNIVQEIEDMNPSIDFGHLSEWDKIEMPLSCTDN